MVVCLFLEEGFEALESTIIKLARNIEKRLHVDLMDTLQMSEGDLFRKQITVYRFQVLY